MKMKKLCNLGAAINLFWGVTALIANDPEAPGWFALAGVIYLFGEQYSKGGEG